MLLTAFSGILVLVRFLYSFLAFFSSSFSLFSLFYPCLLIEEKILWKPK